MKFEVKIPAVGESISEVVLARWLKHDGDAVEVDDLLCEIESDKASFEIPAEHAGVIKTLAKEGDAIQVGAIIAHIDGDGVAQAAGKAKPAETAATPPPAPARETAQPTAAPVEQSEAPATARDGRQEERIKISPVAANILIEAGLSAEQVAGSGPGGRITKEDALKAAQQAPARTKEVPAPPTPRETSPAAAPGPAAQAEPASSPARPERRERLSQLRKTLAKRLVAAKNETAMLTTFNEIDMSAIMALRAKYKEKFKEKHEVGLGFMSFFTRAACLALKEWPAVNAMIDGDFVVYHDYCDISIAVSSPRGLVVPVIRNADSLTLAEIERKVEELATKARENKLTIEEMTGGTFTISNGGVFGSLMSTPIINPPQTAVLGMHKIEERPVVVNGQIVIRPMMYVAMSYDHRIIDGRESVSFVVRLKELLEDPARMLIGV